MATKSELRKIYLERRSTLVPAEINRASTQIADRFFEYLDLREVRTLHTFIRITKFNEIDTSVIYYRIWRDFPRVVTAAPRIDPATGEMTAVRFDAATNWSENKWGIREPTEGQNVDPARVDLVLVPLLCFDELGHRVGYGKGMYDRFLSRCRPACIKVGLSYFPPVDPIDDVWDEDVTLGACVTPDRVYWFDTKE